MLMQRSYALIWYNICLLPSLISAYTQILASLCILRLNDCDDDEKVAVEEDDVHRAMGPIE